MTKALFARPLTGLELYWCGVIHADGCIDRRHRRLQLKQKERHMIEEFLLFIDQKSKITVTKGRTNFGENVGHVMSTMKGVDNLLSLGIKGEVDLDLYEEVDFWRGLVDGDGCVSQGARRPTIGLCSGKPRDILAFSSWIGKLFNCQGPKPHATKVGVWRAMVGHGKARSLAVYMYKGRYSAFPRKQATALSFESLSFRTKTRLIAEEKCREAVYKPAALP